jgi:hypothetical protein
MTAQGPRFDENIRQLPEAEGVFQLYDEDRNILAIKGTANLRKEILLAPKDYDKAAWFVFEDDKMLQKLEFVSDFEIGISNFFGSNGGILCYKVFRILKEALQFSPYSEEVRLNVRVSSRR